MIKLSDYIAQFFFDKGIDVIFGFQGGMITHLVDSIARHPQMRFIQVYHEQTGAIAAESYARINGKPGICISTSGPGATNMITGIADAYFDSIPVIYITGQVNTYEYKYDKRVRQLGFQETDIVSIVRPITKYAVMIDDPVKIRYELEKAYYIAMEGRRGPVLLDIPMNIFRAEIVIETMDKFECEEKQFIHTPHIEKAIEEINTAERPMCLIGGGVISAKATCWVEQLIRQTEIPFVTSLMGKGAIDETLPQYMGMIGSYGNRMANITIHEADVVIVLGSRLDTRQTGAKYESFLKNGRIIHVDIDNGELEDHRIINKRLKIQGDIKDFITVISPKLSNFKIRKEWTTYCQSIKERYNQEKEIKRFVQNKAPYQIIQRLNEYVEVNDIVTADVGQNQMWTAQTIVMKKGMRLLTSGGLAPMGYAMPAAVGAAFSTACNQKIWAITGDGGFHISTQTLMLISQYKLPISVVIINNESLGMITQFQELYFDSLYAGTDSSGGYLVPHIEHIAKAYSIPYYKLYPSDMSNKLLLDKIVTERYVIIEYMTGGKTTVSPKLEFDKSIENQTPYLTDEELASNMFC